MYLLILLASISTFSITATLLNYIQPFFLLGSRMVIAGIILIFYASYQKKLTYQKNHLFTYINISLFAIFLPYALRYYGLTQSISPTDSSFIYNLGPIVTYLLTSALGVESMTIKRSSALMLCFISVLITTTLPLYSLSPLSWGLPELSLLLSLFSFSYGWTKIRTCIINNHYTPTGINGITMLGGGTLALVTSYISEPAPYITTLKTSLPLLALVIIVSNLIAHNLYAYLLTRYSLTMIQISYWLIIFTKGPYKMVLLDPFSLSILHIGTLICFIVGMIIFYTDEPEWQQIKHKIKQTQHA